MNACRIPFCALLVATPMAFGATPQAPSIEDSTTRLAPVTVSAVKPATPPWVDVRSVCPDIDKALQSALSPAWGRVRESGSMRVLFRLEGQRITEVRSGGTAPDYRPYIRRAVAQLDCELASGAGDEFTFLLVIHAPDERAAGSDRIAVLRQ